VRDHHATVPPTTTTTSTTTVPPVPPTTRPRCRAAVDRHGDRQSAGSVARRPATLSVKVTPNTTRSALVDPDLLGQWGTDLLPSVGN
jgi:hypothetical protein